MTEEISASHILCSSDRRSKDEALQEITQIREQIENGADFSDAARKYSDCPSGSRGGDLGQFGRGVMVPEFEEAAFALDEGEISEAIETQFGYHLIQRTS